APGTRIDLVAKTAGAKSCYIEVKNVTLVEGGTARFPDAVTERGRKHLLELERKVAEGERAAMIYLVQRGDAARFRPADDIDPAYGEALRRVAKAGVEVYPLLCEVAPEGVRAKGLLPVDLGG
ncbi:DNA/RNA nuclease SfsA, partial [bacterium]